jgi:hypothetical protein
LKSGKIKSEFWYVSHFKPMKVFIPNEMTRYLSSRSLKFVTEKRETVKPEKSPIERCQPFSQEQAATWERIAPMAEGMLAVVYRSAEEAIEDLYDLLKRLSSPQDLIPGNVILALMMLEGLRVVQGGGWRAEEQELQKVLLKMFDALFYGDRPTALHLTSKSFSLISISRGR